jgi:hypothetical protein
MDEYQAKEVRPAGRGDAELFEGMQRLPLGAGLGITHDDTTGTASTSTGFIFGASDCNPRSRDNQPLLDIFKPSIRVSRVLNQSKYIFYQTTSHFFKSVFVRIFLKLMGGGRGCWF